MAWLFIFILILLLIACVSHVEYSESDYHEDHDYLLQVSALLCIADLKYTKPEVWAKCASSIVGHPVTPPTPEQCEEWKAKQAAKQAQ